MATEKPDPGILEVPLGNAVRGKVAPNAAVVMFVSMGLPTEKLERLVDEVTALQVMLASFRPLFVIDCDEFHVFRRRQYLFEYIPPRDEWVKQFGDAEWQAFLDERMQTLIERYQPEQVIAFEDPERMAILRTGLFDALLSKAPTSSGNKKASGTDVLGPFPSTPVGQLVKKGCELYLNRQPVNPRKLAWRAGRFLNRRARTLRSKK